MNEEITVAENLTFTHQLLKEHNADALDGHHIVVLESTAGGGEKIRRVLVPGEEAKKKGFFEELVPWRKESRCFAYAVPAASFLSAQFGADVKMDDMLHSFTLKIDLTYRVSDPRELVANRNRDPLRIVREAAVGALQKRVASCRWIDITNQFRRVESDVVAAVIPSVNSVANSVGLHVQNIELHHDVPEVHVAVAVAKEKHELDVVKENHANELARIAAGRRILDAGVRALDAGMQNGVTSVRTPTDFVQMIGGVRTLFNGSAGDPFASGGSHLLGGPSAGAQTLLPAAGQSGLASVLIEVVTETSQLNCTPGVKRKLQSALLHLIAELLPEEKPDDEVVNGYRSRVIDAASQASLSGPQSDYLETLVQPRNLRERLQ
ncbi:MAG TPA: hypothetical protein VEO54_26300 [Thermoanaerobaculia bacterium]|nr:hypothetical protein [Thermoanaerobaculia bacterium]